MTGIRIISSRSLAGKLRDSLEKCLAEEVSPRRVRTLFRRIIRLCPLDKFCILIIIFIK